MRHHNKYPSPNFHRSYSYVLTNFPRETDPLFQVTSTQLVSCDVCKIAINIGDPLYHFDMGSLDIYTDDPPFKPQYICQGCVHNFKANGQLNRPYWITLPSLGACSNIRTNNDIGQREILDGTTSEWEDIWSSDMTGTRMP